ncbi:lycopene cyclase family protein [Gordonia sp. CPCC 205333]|uniref:lycopene cyclase family protein n=1 Tax=Gordonia sp. CPCC 205333 TaxID=3140790 RepID=UPI003AF38E0C
MPADRDLLVVGAGPAGRALSFRAAQAGLRVTLVDPDPVRPWRATYGAWTDELPLWLTPDCVAASTTSAVVYTPGRRVIERGYSVLDTEALQRFLSTGVTAVAAAAASVGQHAVTLTTGETLSATTVVDARGTTGQPSSNTPRQTAVGIRRHSRSPEMVVMDWRRPPGMTVAETFSYRVGVGPTVELVEETCLAGAPPIEFRRLGELCAARIGTTIPDTTGSDLDVELVDFALLPVAQPPWRQWGKDPLRFGAAGGLMHPATGYSLAATLSATDFVVDALRVGRDPRAALWPRAARLVYELRVAGLAALLAMKPAELTRFFDIFFGLPLCSQHAYLSSRTDVGGVIRAMWLIFVDLRWRERRHLVLGFTAGVATRTFARMTRCRREPQSSTTTD